VIANHSNRRPVALPSPSGRGIEGEGQTSSRCRQLGFDLDLRNHAPLVPAEVAAYFMKGDHDKVINAIDLGLIRWAFNIAMPGADRAEFRIYRESLDAYIHRDHLQPDYFHDGHSRLLPVVIAACLPPGAKPWFPLASLARLWTCSPSHLSNLVQAGHLAAHQIPGRGPLGSAMILRTSAAAFLHAHCESTCIIKQHTTNVP
jgi:hypothetical protein